jgi:hypothetical protein
VIRINGPGPVPGQIILGNSDVNDTIRINLILKDGKDDQRQNNIKNEKVN